MLFPEVSLFGITTAWRFPGLRALSRWLSAAPWAEQGGICSVITEDFDTPREILTAIYKAAYAENRGQTHLRVICTESGSELGSPLEVCLGSVGLTWGKGKLRIAEELAEKLRAEPILFILTAHNSIPIEWWEALSDFADVYGKRQSFSPLAMVVISNVSTWEIGPKFDFRHGWPEAIDLWIDGMAESERWANYLYMRVAWESGGCLPIAEEMGELVSGVSPGDDEAVESYFNKYSLKAASKILINNQGWLPLFKNMDSSGSASLMGIKSPVSLVWNPPHTLAPRIVPWFCRAALLQKNVPVPLVWKLRSELFCEPLRQGLTAICHHGEALTRTRIFQSGVRTPISEEGKALFEEFNIEPRNNYYPSCHPAYPHDPWAFASLGETIKSSGVRLPEQFRSLLTMRNSIAHGHFVGWRHVKTAIDVMRVIR